jgi:hypothetical protein
MKFAIIKLLRFYYTLSYLQLDHNKSVLIFILLTTCIKALWQAKLVLPMKKNNMSVTSTNIKNVQHPNTKVLLSYALFFRNNKKTLFHCVEKQKALLLKAAVFAFDENCCSKQ